jgi:very-short-patch-repair endonuclease
LWARLRGKGLDGLKFRRQHPIERYVLDFYCPEARLAIEVDGFSHDGGDQAQRDEKRDAWLNSRGIQVLRIAAEDVMRDADEVAAGILAYIRG